MQTPHRATARYWSTPLVGVVIGLLYLVGFWVGGKPADGVGGLALMVAFSAVLMLAGRRSETVRGLLDHRDERIAGMDLQATAFTAVAMIAAVLVGFIVEIAHGRSGSPFDWLGAVGGLAYVAAVAHQRLRR